MILCSTIRIANLHYIFSYICRDAHISVPVEQEDRYRHSYDSKLYGQYDAKHNKVSSLSFIYSLQSVYT